jgi:hypothetical protein
MSERITGLNSPSLSSSQISPDAALEIQGRLKNEYTSGAADIFINSQYNQSYPTKKYKVDGKEVDAQGTAPSSIANRYVLFQFRGLGGSELNISDYKDNPDSRFVNDNQYRLALEPTTTNIIKFFNDTPGNIAMVYSHSDFLYCKYHGKIPNNYLLTLRRFHIPVADDLLSGFTINYVKDGDGNVTSKELVDTRQPDIARAVTWMSEATGNKLEDIIKFTTELPFKEVESELQVLESKAQGIQGSSILGVGVNNGSLGLLGGLASTATVGSNQSSANARELEALAGFDPIKGTYPNYVEGPLYVIKRIMVKDSGIYCAQEFKINFNYELRSYGNVNPKMALLDILANFLVLTYNSAPFWGGAVRYISNGKFGKPLGNHALLASGNLSGFLSSLVKDAGSIMGKVFGNGQGGFSIDSIAGGAGKIAGDMLGGWLSKNFNTPQGAQGTHAFLSGAPTGCWHLTIGNPLNPIAMVGNLVCTQAEYSFEGPLGKDDFPTTLNISVTLKSGRDRDKGDIENMFNGGRGRLYQVPEGMDDYANISGLQPNVVNAYNNAKLAQSQSNSLPKIFRGYNPSSDKLQTIQEAANKVYDQSKDSGAFNWVNNKFPNVTENIVAGVRVISQAVKHG